MNEQIDPQLAAQAIQGWKLFPRIRAAFPDTVAYYDHLAAVRDGRASTVTANDARDPTLTKGVLHD